MDSTTAVSMSTMSKYRFKGASAGLAGRSFTLEQELWLGSGDDCQIVVKDTGINPRHVRIYQHQGQVLLETRQSEGDNGTVWINGQAVVQATLASGDELRLGSARLVFQAPGLRPASVLREQPQRRTPWGWIVGGAVIVAAAAAGAAYWLGWF